MLRYKATSRNKEAALLRYKAISQNREDFLILKVSKSIKDTKAKAPKLLRGFALFIIELID